ncbi:cation:proton antiporter family protein [Halomonas binhaiensis]|uniref:Cation:proton antiporter n=1 Tax=Halomonas binhaiensis TaxID=2562282 RepID=A0A5C1NI42_9GAMM|nr:cation:proton antiporter family protein [Halomonas binhaiensis]QEM82530.1 cation:proton antiporter [Halomonas binhaiensis]
MIEPIFILTAFVSGAAAMLLRQPPLVGFLAGGFLLNAMGYDEIPVLTMVSHLGVTLMLFTIGLKLNIRTLLRHEVWGGASLHMLTTVAILTSVLALGQAIALPLLASSDNPLISEMDLPALLVLAFALSFSSTVFVVKVLEKRSETQTSYGRLAIGILIMQDLFAVVFLTASTGQLPSIWAIGLLALLPLAPYMRRLLERMGHGEMQMLCGIMMALVLGYGLFELAGIKGDLGALIIGLLLAPHPAAQNLARSMFNIKELLLVGFFFSIGFTALPTWSSLGIAALLVLLLPLKSLVYQIILMRFHMRHRTSILATLSLSNYSEFGLIVSAIAVSSGWMAPEWLVVMSLAVAMSFILSALINSVNEQFYRWIEPYLPDTDSATLSADDRPISIGDAEAIVLGMGRIGRSVYRRLSKEHGLKVLGIDSNPKSVQTLSSQGFNILEGDAVDSDFWDKMLMSSQIRLVVLAMPHHAGNLSALKQLRSRHFPGNITAIVEYPEEVDPIRELGANAVYHVYDEAGRALADSAAEQAGLVTRSEQLG